MGWSSKWWPGRASNTENFVDAEAWSLPIPYMYIYQKHLANVGKLNQPTRVVDTS